MSDDKAVNSSDYIPPLGEARVSGSKRSDDVEQA